MADLPVAEEPATAEAEVSEEKLVPTDVEGPKARRRPRARKKLEESAEAAAQTEEAAMPTAEATGGDKPKRKTRASVFSRGSAPSL